ncbi:MAG: alpha/beta fold hydrolase [Planctomycetota bacterium]|jgi:predicted peptidase|nr:alpha/beta fold hydrolase [Planctomycetota bacterium]
MNTVYEEHSVSVLEHGEPARFRYRLLRPAQSEPGKTYPLLLFLHGAGERGSDNLAQIKYLPTWLAEPELRDRYPCFVVAPQCRADHRWAPFDWSDKKSSPLAIEPTGDLAAAVAAVDAVVAAEPIDPDRIYLTGLSMGGYGAWELAARTPHRFAAVAPICGGGDEAQAAKLVGLPIWCFHGGDDKVVPVERSRSMVAAVKAAGGMPKYTELPGVGHDSWTPAYRNSDLLDWLFRQRRLAATRDE